MAQFENFGSYYAQNSKYANKNKGNNGFENFGSYYAQNSKYANKDKKDDLSVDSNTSTQDIDKRISEAEEKVKNAEEYAQRINSRFAWIGDKGRERAGLKPLGADYEGPTNYKQGLAEAKAELTAAKDEKWWAEAANDLTDIYSQTDNSSTYTDNQQKANEVLDKMSSSVIGDFWHINDDELATLMTLREEDPELADRYYEILEYALNERKAEAQAEDISNRSTIGKIGTYLGAGFSAPGSLFDTIGSAIREGITGEYKPADLNSDAYWGSRTRAQISDELLSGIDSPFVRFLAETGLSAADYLTKLPFGGPAALGIMSATSAGETAYDALARGASAADAAWSGIANGAVTALTEKLPLDNLFRIARSGAGFLTRNGIKNVLQQSGIEATEELVSSYLNTLTDIAINGDKSNYNLTVENYIQNGMSREEAEKQANEDFFILDPLRSAAGGALSGFAFGSGGTMLGNIRNRYNRANVDNNNNYPYDTSRGDLNDVENIGERSPGGETRGMPREERSSGTGYDGELLHNPTRETGVLSEESGRGLPVGSATGSDGGNGESSAIQGNRISGLSPEQQQRLEGTAGRNNLVNKQKYTTEQLRTIYEYQNSVDNELLSFINKIRNLKNKNVADKINQTISPVSERSAQDIKELTGIDVRGFNHNFNGGRVNHIISGHGSSGTTDSSMADVNDLARIGYVLNNYDTIELATNNSDTDSNWQYRDKNNKAAPKIIYKKRIDGTYYVVEAVADSNAKRLQIVSAYIESAKSRQNKEAKNNIGLNNKEEGPQVSDAEAPNDTPEAAHALLSSNLNISQNSEKINSDQGQNSPPTDSFRTPEGEGEAVANQFAENSLQKAAEAGTVNKKIADALEGSTHQRVSNQQLIEQAQKAITDNDPDPVAQYLRDKVNRGNGLNSVETTAGLMLIEDYSRQGNVQAATDLADTMMQASSDGARALQALKLIQKNLPGSFITLANKTLARKGLPMLNETEVNTINALQTLANEADNIMTIENAEQRQAAIDEIVANVDPQYQKYINKLFKGKNKKDLSDWFLLLTQKVVSDKTPATWLDKMRSWQRINLLLNIKTNLRNFLGNAVFGTAETLGNATVAPWVDRLLSLRTGQRTATLPQLGAAAKGMAQGARDTVTAAQTGTLSMLGNRYSDAPDSATRPFNKKILRWLDNATTATLTFGDKIFSGAREADVAAQLRKINPNLSETEIAEIAHQLALEATFQNDSGIAFGLLKARDLPKMIGDWRRRKTGDTNARYPAEAIGNVITYGAIPFAKTPANVLQQVINYSPLGLANGITKAIKVATRGQNASPQFQRQAVDAIARGLSGSGMMGLGVLLASLGLASGGSSEEDKRYREANGISDNSIKFSIGGKDYWIDFSSLGPIPAAINTGASIWNELQEEMGWNVALAIVQQLFSAPISDVTQDDLWSGMVDMAGYLGEGDITRAIQEIFGDTATQAVLLGSFLRMITGIVDPYSRETSSDNELGWTSNRILSQLPGLSNTLPIKYDAYGEPVKRYDTADNLGERLLWSSIVPWNVSRDMSDNPVTQEATRLYSETGETSVLPQDAPYNIQYGGESYDLVGQNRSDYAKTAGQFASQSILDVLDSPTYINASDEEKVDILSAILDVGREDAKQDFFATESIPYASTNTASNQLDFVNNMEQYGLTSGDAVALYKGVKNEDTSSNAAKAKAILDSGLTGVQKIAAANELFKDSSDTFISNLSEAIMRGIADEWVQLYGLVQDKENNEYAYSEEFINTYFDLLTQGMSPSDKQWIQSTLRRWRMIPQEIF